MLIAAITASLLIAAAAQDPVPDPRVDAIFKDYDSKTSPGCAVAVYGDDKIIYKRAYGMANLDHDVPLSTSSVFHVASISKQFTAAAILLLAQDGKLSLDDEVRKYVPELPDFGKRITLRHLANHTSGIRDQWDLLDLAGWRYSQDLITDGDVLALLSRQKDLNFTPGEKHLYSNSGYTLLATVVARVSGKSFREFTTERIFAPLGMTNTHFRDSFTEIVKNQAYGYAPSRNTFRLSTTNFDTAGATSLLTTVEDMAKWNANFDKGTVGGGKLAELLLDRAVLNDGRKIDYAVGMTHGAYRSAATVGHGGADAGYRADLVRFPNAHLGVATFCNISTANPNALARRVAEVFLPAGSLAPPAGPPAEDAPEVTIPEETLKRYAGIYWNEADAVVREVAFEGGRLHAVQGAQKAPFKSLGNGQFALTTGARTRVIFADTKDGVRMTMAGNQVYVPVQPFAPDAAKLEEFAGTYRSDEMDAVFRMVVKDGTLHLERIKQGATPMQPLFKDAFRNPNGVFQFTRDSSGRISGFLLEAGRVRHLKFWKDSSRDCRCPALPCAPRGPQ